MQIRTRRLLQIHAVLVGAAFAVTGCAQPAIPAAPASVGTTAAATKASFGATVVLKVGHAVSFADGLSMVLDKVDDSRCPPVVSCVWAGELAPHLTLHGGAVGAPQAVLLGTVARKKLEVAGYALALMAAGTDSATLVVTRAGATGK